MQPYLFPYIGYFQLIKAVDIFVFYDDVNYIKQGWINRNRILLNDKDHYLTIPCIKPSQNKLINEILYDQKSTEFNKILKTLEIAYKKAPYFKEIYPIICSILNRPFISISILAQQSIMSLCEYLGMKTIFKTSSSSYPETRGIDKADRLIEICLKSSSNIYINALGGQELYEKKYFENKNVELYFIKSQPIEYKQFKNNFVPWLSMIDVLMFNSIEETKLLLDKYELV